jgi:RNA polymerase sigma-70 factor (ECF subfamily)
MKPTTEAIWNEFSEKLGHFIRTRVADSATADDILQDVFLKLQSQIEQFRDPAKLQGWLFLVARNAIIDYYRTRKKTSELTDTLPVEEPQNGVETEELKEVFHRLIYSLPKTYRDALVLTEFDGLTHQQLATRLGISVSGAKSRVQRGREQLKNLLIDYCHREFSRTVGAQPCPKGLLPPVGTVIEPPANPPRPRPLPRPRIKDRGRGRG